MIGIIGAMEEEVAALQRDMEIEETRKIASMEFYKGRLCGQEAVVVRSGVGKVNAGICGAILSLEFGADVLINTGIAGGLHPDIRIGDMVISRDALHHDMDASAFGDPRGQVPRMDVWAFPAEEELIERAKKANQRANPDIQTFVGRVVTGDQFVSSEEKKQELTELFGGMCVEMEGAGIAQAAYLNRIPYVIVRSISDQADHCATEDYPTFEKKAITHSVRLIREMLGNWGKLD